MSINFNLGLMLLYAIISTGLACFCHLIVYAIIKIAKAYFDKLTWKTVNQLLACNFIIDGAVASFDIFTCVLFIIYIVRGLEIAYH